MSNSSAQVSLAGVIVPTICPLTNDGKIDTTSFRRHVRFLQESRADGLWLNGTTGEFPALTAEDQGVLVEQAIQACENGMPVFVHCGGNATRIVIRRAKTAKALGATLIAALPPCFMEFTSEEIVNYYDRIAQAIGEPVIVYQHPSSGRPPLPVTTLLELADRGTIAGIKESSTDLEYYRELTTACRESGNPLKCFHGSGAVAHACLSMGSAGMISIISNVIPHVCVNLYRGIRRGDSSAALDAQRKINELGDAIAHAISQRGNSPPTIAVYKWLLHQQGIIATSQVFEPLTPLTPDEIAEISRTALPILKRLSTGITKEASAEKAEVESRSADQPRLPDATTK
ncbi:MAG: dihydrodipicolinate synthase family protein [Planctomycetota bacterium]|jgi:4-hydroxy-tetrahydrodipicolinate synthase